MYSYVVLQTSARKTAVYLEDDYPTALKYRGKDVKVYEIPLTRLPALKALGERDQSAFIQEVRTYVCLYDTTQTPPVLFQAAGSRLEAQESSKKPGKQKKEQQVAPEKPATRRQVKPAPSEPVPPALSSARSTRRKSATVVAKTSGKSATSSSHPAKPAPKPAQTRKPRKKRKKRPPSISQRLMDYFFE